MIKVNLYRINDKLFPADENSTRQMFLLKEGMPYYAQIWQPRNIKLHNLYFALLRVFVHNTDMLEFMPKDDSITAENAAVEAFRKAVLIYIGVVDKVHLLDGKSIIDVPKSVSFESMDEEEFRSTVFEPTIKIICKLLQCTEQELLEMAGDYI